MSWMAGWSLSNPFGAVLTWLHLREVIYELKEIQGSSLSIYILRLAPFCILFKTFKSNWSNNYYFSVKLI